MIQHPVLQDLERFGIHLGLTRMRSFLASLGDPHRSAPVIHIAGTNGKGSTVRMIAEILRTAGLRVGDTTSPHLWRVNERIRVDGREISDDQLDGLLRELDIARRRWSEENVTNDEDRQHVLTYFEMITAAAFVHFSTQHVDVAVIEVGMGGRLDATNVVDPVATAVVTIGLDHMERLGPDLASIAAEKGGIIKRGVPVVLGRLQPMPSKVLRALAIDRNAPVIEAGVDFRVQGHTDELTIRFGDQVLSDLVVGLHGEHQLDNAAVAVAVVRSLPERLRPPDDAIRRGLRTSRHAGRLEQLAPDLLVDCAHNADGAATLAAHLRSLPRERPRTLVLGASNDKAVRAMVMSLAPCVDRILTTSCDHPRAATPGELAEQLVGVGVPVLPAGPIEEALPMAQDGKSLVVVAGSIFLVGAVRELVGAR